MIRNRASSLIAFFVLFYLFTPSLKPDLLAADKPRISTKADAPEIKLGKEFKLTEQLSHLFSEYGAEWVMYLLFLLSFLSIVVMIERGIFYLLTREDLLKMTTEIQACLKKGPGQAMVLYPKEQSMEQRCANIGLKSIAEGPEAVNNLIQGSITQEKKRYEKNLIFLGTLGNNAPFIGLFGTVIGIIKAFKDLAISQAGISGSSAQTNTSAVMTGISEALVATAVGLIVAIPAVVAYNYFHKRVKLSVTNSAAIANVIISYHRQNPGDAEEKKSGNKDN